MSEALDLDRAPEKMKEPAKRWRNRWMVRSAFHRHCDVCGDWVSLEQGEEYSGHCTTYPTEDEARTSAADQLAQGASDAYLGPIPEPAP